MGQLVGANVWSPVVNQQGAGEGGGGGVASTFFLSQADDLYTFPSDLSAGPTLLRTGTEGGEITDIMVDHVNEKLLVMNHTNDKIYHCDLDGSNFTTLLTSPVAMQSLNGMYVDEDAEKVYWSALGRMYRANLDGSTIEQISTLNPGSLAYEPDSDWIFFPLATGNPYPSYHIHPDGSSAANLGNTNNNDALSICVDLASYVFIGDSNGDINRWTIPSAATKVQPWHNGSTAVDWYSVKHDHLSNAIYALAVGSLSSAEVGIYRMLNINGATSNRAKVADLNVHLPTARAIALRYSGNLQGLR